MISFSNKNANWSNSDVCNGPKINVETIIPFEYYRLSFYFNSKESSKCILRIEGKYNDQEKVHNICDFTKESSYLELYNETKTFIEFTNEINSSESQETLFEDEF